MRNHILCLTLSPQRPPFSLLLSSCFFFPTFFHSSPAASPSCCSMNPLPMPNSATTTSWASCRPSIPSLPCTPASPSQARTFPTWVFVPLRSPKILPRRNRSLMRCNGLSCCLVMLETLRIHHRAPHFPCCPLIFLFLKPLQRISQTTSSRG